MSGQFPSQPPGLTEGQDTRSNLASPSQETGTLRSSSGRQPAAADQAHDPQVSMEWEFLGRRRVSRPVRTGAQALV